MDELLAGLKAVAETTRLRILFALSQSEMNVTELTQLLKQSQPRVSRHLKLMAEVGLISRRREGNWVLLRQSEEGVGGVLSRALVNLLSVDDAQLALDMQALAEIRQQRQTQALAYFAANAAQWQRLRSLHVREDEVEAQFLALLKARKFDCVLDLGTGTGRILELLAPQARQLWGLDQSRAMLAIARANLDQHKIKNARVRQADIYALPFADEMADLISIHQVLHFLDDPQAALVEACRVLRPLGEMIIVDFAPHELEDLRNSHAHRRLGLSAEQMAGYFARAGLALRKHKVLPPPKLKNGPGLTVSLWLGVKSSQAAMAQNHTRVEAS